MNYAYIFPQDNLKDLRFLIAQLGGEVTQITEDPNSLDRQLILRDMGQHLLGLLKPHDVLLLHELGRLGPVRWQVMQEVERIHNRRVKIFSLDLLPMNFPDTGSMVLTVANAVEAVPPMPIVPHRKPMDKKPIISQYANEAIQFAADKKLRGWTWPQIKAYLKAMGYIDNARRKKKRWSWASFEQLVREEIRRREAAIGTPRSPYDGG